MANVVLNDLTSGYNLSKINDNFGVIETALNTDRLQLTDGGNVMSQDLDMNSHDIMNVGTLSTQFITLNGQQVALPELVVTDAITQETLASSTGAGMVGFEQVATGAILRTAQDKLSDLIYVEDFGAVGDGSTDDTTSIQAAINAVISRGGGEVNFGPKTYKVTSTLLINHNNIFLRGCGSNKPVDGGTGAVYSTRLLWAGGSTGAVVNFETPLGTGNSKRSGGGAYGIFVECSGLAQYGFRVCSWDKLTLQECHSNNATVACYKLTCWSTTQLAEAADTQYCLLDRCSFNMLGNAAAYAATGILLTSEAVGTSTADTSLCRIIDCVGKVKDGVGLYIQDADNNYIENVRGFVVGTGWAYVLDGTYSNVFVGCPIGNNIRMLGTASGSFRNSTLNTFIACDDANASGSPVVDTGCTYQIHGTKFGWGGFLSGPATFAGTRSVAQTQQANVTTETLRVSSGASDHIRVVSGANEWGINIDGSGNLRLNRVSGTGGISLANIINYGTFATHSDAPITGYITINDGLGNPRKLAVIA